MSYARSLARIADASRPGMRLGLATTRALLSALGDPQAGMPGVLVAGTNGKGSVCAMVDAIAREAGHRVALLTKPHLTSYRERISLGGQPISEELFADLVDRVLAAAARMDQSAGSPSHHELLTAMGFLAAREWSAELTVCEVGLGGRLDASNVWDGGVACVVTVGLDHQAQLGNTVPEIAREKAAIIKAGNLAVSGVSAEALPEVEAASLRAKASLWQLGREIELSEQGGALRVRTPRRELGEIRPAVEGVHQRANCALAVAVADRLQELGHPIDDGAITKGLSRASWPGRLDTIQLRPKVVVDAAHNPAAVQAVLPDLQRLAREHQPTVLLFGSMSDHDHRGMLQLLEQLRPDQVVISAARSGRAASAAQLASEWGGDCEVVEPVGAATRRAIELAGEAGLVLSLGSIYVIGEVMAELGVGLPPDPEFSHPPLW